MGEKEDGFWQWVQVLKFGDFDSGYHAAGNVGGSSSAVLGVPGLQWPAVSEGRGKRDEGRERFV